MDVNSLFVFCLEMKPKEEGSDEDKKPLVTYNYPRKYFSLLETESMLAVLCNVSEDLTGKPAQTSVLTDNEGKHMWVKYHKEGHNIVIFIAKSDLAYDQTITSLFRSVMHLIFILYGSVEKAFCQKRFHGKLNGIFSSAEEKLKNLFQPSPETVFHPGFDFVPMYSLPVNYQDNLSKILSVLESKRPGRGDFKTRNQSPHSVRQFFILGSCVFFNEYLLCSHLSPKHLEDVHVYLKYNGLLSQQMGQQIVLWREIYLSVEENQKDLMLGYIEQPSQCHLLVVCHRPYFIAALLQSPKPVSVKNTNTLSSTIPPPPLYIEKLKAALSQIESTIVGFCESCLENNKDARKMKNLSFTDQIATLLKSPNRKQKHSCNMADQIAANCSRYANISNLTLSPPCMDSAKDDSRTILCLNSKYSSSARICPTSFPNRFMAQSDANLSDFQQQAFQDQIHPEMKLSSLNLVTSLHSRFPCCYGVVALLHMCAHKGHLSTGVHINGCCGIHQVIKPELSRCCSLIMANFKTSKLFGRNQRRSSEGNNTEHRSSSQTLLEYGVLLQTRTLIPKQKEKECHSTDLWVVGKQMYREKDGLQQTVFICFKDGVEQGLVDLAFSFPFGLNWVGGS